MNKQDAGKTPTILSQVAALGRMSEHDLREQWRALFGSEPPAYRPSVLVRRLAHRVQELKWGGLQADTRRRIDERRVTLGLDDSAFKATTRKRQSDAPVPGTRFVREWNETRHEVTVTRDGYEYQGRNYRSLTAIAKAITGTHWNGRAFFGLAKTNSIKGGRA